MAVWAIGDIQGCGDEFEALLARIQFDPAHDQLWITGDLVNRGPRSLAVLRRVKALGHAAITVLGNHDLHLLALASDIKARKKSKDTLDEVLNAPDRDELLYWLRHQPLIHHDAALRMTMIHAGLPPQWDLLTALRVAKEVEAALQNEAHASELFAHMYGDEPDEWHEHLSGFARLRFITNCLTRLRACTAQGKIKLKLKSAPHKFPAGVYPWFRVPQRCSLGERFVFGHWSALGFFNGLHNADGVLALDTGCVWGGTLSAMRLDIDAAPVMQPCLFGGVQTDD